jgi:4-amino-4-deoxy-L-arabinose transferase-like glycosyltransferase
MRLTRPVFLTLLFAVAFAVRLGTVVALRDVRVGPQGIACADDVEFNTIAAHLAAGKGYTNAAGLPTSMRAPGFPVFLAALYSVVGERPPVAYLTFCLLGAASCLLTYLLARELFSEGWARLAGVLAAVNLPHAYFAAVYVSENLFVPLLILSAWLVVRHLKRDSFPSLVAAGIVLGYAALTRPFALLLLPAFLAAVVWSQWRQRSWLLTPAAALVVSFFAVILPWTARNYRVFGHPVLIANNGGSTFYGGNNDRVLREPNLFGYWLSTTELPHRDLVDAAPDEITHDKVEWRLGLDWVKQHPGALPRLAVYKVVRLWAWPHDWDGGKPYYVPLRVATFAPYLLLYTLGVLRCLRSRDYWTPPWLVVHAGMLATVATAVVFWGSPRFRDANLGFLMLYAVLGVQALVDWSRRLRRAARRPILAKDLLLSPAPGRQPQRVGS